MKNIFTAYAALLAVGMSGPAHAAFEWKETRALQIESQALATATSADGQWLYVLTPGEVLIYALGENRIETRIPVDRAFDTLTFSPTTNSLILSGKTAKMIRVVQLDQVHVFSYDGLAFLGPENAPVTIAVFSDYQ